MFCVLLVNLLVILVVKRMRIILMLFFKSIFVGLDVFFGWNILFVIIISILLIFGWLLLFFVKLMLVIKLKLFFKWVNCLFCVIFLIVRIVFIFDEYWFKLNFSLVLFEKLIVLKCVFLLYKLDVCIIFFINFNWFWKELLVLFLLLLIKKMIFKGLYFIENVNW